MDGVDGSANGEEDRMSSPFQLSEVQPTNCCRKDQGVCKTMVGGQPSARETDRSIPLAWIGEHKDGVKRWNGWFTRHATAVLLATAVS